MRAMMVLIGFVVIVVGLLPYIVNIEAIPDFIKAVPSSGVSYQMIIVAVGALAVLYGLRRRL